MRECQIASGALLMVALWLGGCVAPSPSPSVPGGIAAAPAEAVAGTDAAASPANPASVALPGGAARAVRFPEDWFGRWEGPAELLYPDGRKVPFRMGLTVAPLTNAEGACSWTITYDGAQGFQERGYLLRPVDKAKNLWEIDERNGIVLPCSWIGESLVSGFAVPGNRIITIDRIERVGTGAEALVSEMHSFPTKRDAATGGKGPQAVTTHQAASTQRAVLKRLGQ